MAEKNLTKVVGKEGNPSPSCPITMRKKRNGFTDQYEGASADKEKRLFSKSIEIAMGHKKVHSIRGEETRRKGTIPTSAGLRNGQSPANVQELAPGENFFWGAWGGGI